MAAPIAAPACKFIFEKSNLKHPKSRYKNVIKKKCFNHSVSACLNSKMTLAKMGLTLVNSNLALALQPPGSGYRH